MHKPNTKAMEYAAGGRTAKKAMALLTAGAVLVSSTAHALPQPKLTPYSALSRPPVAGKPAKEQPEQKESWRKKLPFQFALNDSIRPNLEERRIRMNPMLAEIAKMIGENMQVEFHGGKMYFAADGDTAQIYICKMDGTGQRAVRLQNKLFDNPAGAKVKNPALLAFDGMLAYTASGADYLLFVKIAEDDTLDVTSLDLRLLKKDKFENPVLRRGGSFVYLTGSNTDWIYVIDPKKGYVAQIPKAGVPEDEFGRIFGS